jgi:hypothetical protein
MKYLTMSIFILLSVLLLYIVYYLPKKFFSEYNYLYKIAKNNIDNRLSDYLTQGYNPEVKGAISKKWENTNFNIGTLPKSLINNVFYSFIEIEKGEAFDSEKNETIKIPLNIWYELKTEYLKNTK